MSTDGGAQSYSLIKHDGTHSRRSINFTTSHVRTTLISLYFIMMLYQIKMTDIQIITSLYVETDDPRLSVVKRAGSVAPSGTEAEDTGDELLESAFRSAATAGPRQRGERKRSQYRHRKSCK